MKTILGVASAQYIGYVSKRFEYFCGRLIKNKIMSEFPPCPKCKSEYVYPSDGLLICPECFHEWNPEDEAATVAEDSGFKVIDSNGNELQDGDTVVVIKDLPVKGAPKSVKAGTKVKNIRLREGNDGHNIDCKIDGFGAMGLKSEFVRKA
jgi:protein PhnA